MNTKMELSDGVVKLTLIPISAFEKALVNTINVYNAKIEAHRPDLSKVDDTKLPEMVDGKPVTALVITLANI